MKTKSVLIVSVLVVSVLIACTSAGAQTSSKPADLTINPQRTAVLVCHMMNEQLSYKPGVSVYGPEFAEENKKLHIVDKMKAVLDASRTKGVQVIYVRMGYRPGHPELAPQDEMPPNRQRSRPQKMYLEGSWNVQIVDELKPQGNDIVVVNQSASAFLFNDLDIILRNRNTRYLVIAGFSTGVIVTGTMIDAYNRGFYNYLLKDCCNDRNKLHDLLIEKILPPFGVIIDSNQYLQALEKIKK